MSAGGLPRPTRAPCQCCKLRIVTSCGRTNPAAPAIQMFFFTEPSWNHSLCGCNIKPLRTPKWLGWKLPAHKDVFLPYGNVPMSCFRKKLFMSQHKTGRLEGAGVATDPHVPCKHLPTRQKEAGKAKSRSWLSKNKGTRNDGIYEYAFNYMGIVSWVWYKIWSLPHIPRK